MATSMSKPDFILVGGHPALDFVNALDWRFLFEGREENLKKYAAFLHFFVRSRLLTSRQARLLQQSNGARVTASALLRAKELREAISLVFYTRLDQGNSSAAARQAMKRYLHVAQPYHSLDWVGPKFRLGCAKMETAVEYPLWLLVRSASGLILSENVKNVRACANPDCRLLFLGSIHTAPRRWCHNAICGNRIRVSVLSSPLARPLV